MLSIINSIIDRCFFTITFILGVQLPEFIQQYQQRLSGHLNESKLQLAQFETIAQQHFDGSLITMISRYKSNSEASIVNTGELIERLTHRVQYLTDHLEQITSTDYLNQIYLFVRHLDQQIAIATTEQFSMAIPVELHAIATGATLAIGALIVKELTYTAVKYPFRQKKTDTI